MQIEDWGKTLDKNFSIYAEFFADIAKQHVNDTINKSFNFALLYLNHQPAAMCAIEELTELPQITYVRSRTGGIAVL